MFYKLLVCALFLTCGLLTAKGQDSCDLCPKSYEDCKEFALEKELSEYFVCFRNNLGNQGITPTEINIEINVTQGSMNALIGPPGYCFTHSTRFCDDSLSGNEGAPTPIKIKGAYEQLKMTAQANDTRGKIQVTYPANAIKRFDVKFGQRCKDFN